MTSVFASDLDKERKSITIGITAGSFDLFHAGHMISFAEISQNCDKLIVLLQSDPTLDRPDSKNKPVQSIVERQIQLLSCKFVHSVIIYDTESDLLDLLKILDYDYRFLGEDWYNKQFTGFDLPGHLDKCRYTKRTHSWSTSILRTKICESEKLTVKKS